LIVTLLSSVSANTEVAILWPSRGREHWSYTPEEGRVDWPRKVADKDVMVMGSFMSVLCLIAINLEFIGRC
jgi:hypothetical protein